MRAVSLTKEKRFAHGVFTACVALLAGCAPTQPIIVNPIEPWEDELVRERQAAEASQSSKSSIAHRMYGTHTDDDDEGEKTQNSAVVVALTDIIGFPFRGAGWLAQQIF